MMRKKKIRIAHLYYDLMNLYGENGNIKVLEHLIESQGIDVQIDRFSLGDKIDFKKYDFFYWGSGTEEAALLALGDAKKFKDDIKRSIREGRVFLVTGNAMQLFGSKIITRDGRTAEGLKLFDYEAYPAPERVVGEQVRVFEGAKEIEGRYVVGFKNCDEVITNNSYDKPFGEQDNIRVENFFGMMFFGPVLARNPYFADYLLNILFERRDLEYVPNTDRLDYVAYRTYVKNFVSNANLD